MNPITALVVDIDAEINWEYNHPITHSLLMELGRDIVRLSKHQRTFIKNVVGKMEEETNEAKKAHMNLRNHVIWHIEKNSSKPAYTK